MAEHALALQGFGLSFGEQVVLAEVDLRVPRRGIHVLMGPTGAGKSSLLRTVCGLNDPQPGMRSWGERHSRGGRPTLVAQGARFLVSSLRENLSAALPNRASLTHGEQLERIRSALDEARLEFLYEDLELDAIELPLHLQRRLALVCAMLAEPTVLCLDEPTVGLSEAHTKKLLEQVSLYAQRVGVLFVTHDQSVAKALGGELSLLAGGRIQEHGPTRRVLEAPEGEVARHFVRTGSCDLPSPTTPANLLRTDAPPPSPLPEPARASMQRAKGPRHFYWLIEKRLGGLPRPGIVRDVEVDIAGLVELGVQVLYTLEEQQTVPADALARAGIGSRWVPIPDMGVPSLEAMESLCRELERNVERGTPCAVHCLAGLGRTGTVLACFLIARGSTPHAALERVRALRPWAVQSSAQHSYLLSFERFLRSQNCG